MTQITVDLDDLEALIFSTGAIKVIETAVDQSKKDPFRLQHKSRLTGAHDRLATAARNIRRGQEPAYNYNKPLTTAEANYLAQICAAYDPSDAQKRFIRITANERLDKPPEGRPEINQLAAKGMIEIGAPVTGVVWSGAEHAEVTPDPTGYLLRPTKQGLQQWEKR